VIGCIITKCGSAILFDELDYDLVSSRKWRVQKRSKKDGAQPAKVISGKSPDIVSLHDILMNPKQGFIVDHIDGNPLNNQRGNLRVCTQAENACNRKTYKNNKSSVKGIYWMPRQNAWAARITKSGKRLFLGYYKKLEDAAKAYKNAADNLHGEFACYGR